MRGLTATGLTLTATRCPYLALIELDCSGKLVEVELGSNEIEQLGCSEFRQGTILNWPPGYFLANPMRGAARDRSITRVRVRVTMPRLT